MFSKTLLSLLRVCFLTDVEGDIHYFNRFMHISKILRWRDKITHSTVHIPESILNVNVLQKYEIDFQEEFVSTMHPSATPCHPEKCVEAITSTKGCEEILKVNTDTKSVDVIDNNKNEKIREKVNCCDSNELEECEHNNSTTEDVTHFVYGGDAFDHGDDLTFARLLLDFKARYPNRVHLMLGNRDLNKLVLGPLVQCVSDLTPEEAQHRAFPLTRLTGSLHPQIISYREFLHQCYKRELHKKEREHSKNENDDDRDSKSKAVERHDKNIESVKSDKVSFLQWALKYKMGCTDTFEHRRNELAALANTTHCEHNFCDNSRDSVIITDEEVAESFFAAIKPGGVYYEYMHQGELMLKLSSLLFVHGGINEINLQFVPLLHARRQEREHHVKINNASNTRNGTRENTSFNTLHNKEQETEHVINTKHNLETKMEEEEKVLASEEEIVLANNANGSRVYGRQLPSEEINDWIDALHQFKENSLIEWEDAMNEWRQQNDERGTYCSSDDQNTNNCSPEYCYTTSFVGGEVLRQYCYPRLWAPHSVVVNSFIGLHGPQYATLPVVSYLLQNGVQVVCSGHQPCGDSPTLLFQPPHGSFVLIDGDNSYCSRGTDSFLSTKSLYNINHKEIAHKKKQENEEYYYYNSGSSKENENEEKVQEIYKNFICKQTDNSDRECNESHITNNSTKEPFSENKEQMRSVTQINRRGAAVQEIIFEVEDMEEEEIDIKSTIKMSETYHDDNRQDSDVTPNKITHVNEEENEDESNYFIEKNEKNGDNKLRVWVHGKRSDGRCFAFDASPATCFSALTFSSIQTKQNRKHEHKNYLGRRMKDGWWVKIPLSQCDYDAWQNKQEQIQQQKQQNEKHLEEYSLLQDFSRENNSKVSYNEERNAMQETNKSSECNVKEDNVSETKLAHDQEKLAALIRRIQSTEIVAYELHKTSNAFRSEEVKIVTVSELEKMLLEQQKEQHQQCQEPEKYDGCFSVGGELVSRWSTEELAYKEIHRLKTKVTPTNV